MRTVSTFQTKVSVSLSRSSSLTYLQYFIFERSNKKIRVFVTFSKCDSLSEFVCPLLNNDGGQKELLVAFMGIEDSFLFIARFLCGWKHFRLVFSFSGSCGRSGFVFECIL